MATDKQIAANRRNAQKSTGPKTLIGRTASSRNAFRHGLTKPLTDDPAMLIEAHRLAAIIAADKPYLQSSDDVLELALAHLAIRRVRAMRNHALSLLVTALGDSSDAQLVKHLGGFDRYERLARQRQKKLFAHSKRVSTSLIEKPNSTSQLPLVVTSLERYAVQRPTTYVLL